MAQARVPKFGDWEAGTVPYTQYFDNARKNKGGTKMINPNDPDQNPEAYPIDVSPAHAPPARAGPNIGAPKPKDVQPMRREDGDVRRTTEPPLRSEASRRKPSVDPPHQQYRDQVKYVDSHRRPGRINAGNQSSLHAVYQKKSGSRGGVHDSSLERKASSEGQGLAPITPGRSRKKPSGQGYESPEKDVSVPKFGGWNESNPSSGENYTDIFNKLREVRASPSASNVSSHPNVHQKNKSPEKKKCSCFSWLAP